MSEQPEALRLADLLEKMPLGECDEQAAAELRRLSAVEAQRDALLEALEICVCAMQDYQAGIGITEMFDKGERLGRAAIKAVEEGK